MGSIIKKDTNKVALAIGNKAGYTANKSRGHVAGVKMRVIPILGSGPEGADDLCCHT